MKTLYEPKFEVPVGVALLDNYEGPTGSLPPDDFVVTRRRDGTPASLFRELVWDYSAYNPEGRTHRLYFAYWGRDAETPSRLSRAHEIQNIVFALIWRRAGSALGTGTLNNYLTVLCALGQFAESQEKTLAGVLRSADTLRNFVVTSCSGWMAETLGSLLRLLALMDSAAVGFELVSDATIAELSKQNKNYRATLKQHSPIPTRIYSLLINGLQAELAKWLSSADAILSTVKVCGENQRMGRGIGTQRELARESGVPLEDLPTFEEIAPPACLGYIKSKNKAPNVKSLSRLVTEVQVTAKLIIQTFTGMRDDEAASLPYHCIEISIVNGKTRYIVKGRTTKLNGGLVKRTRWVTNFDGYQAIQAAQAIARAVYSVYGVEPVEAKGRSTSHPLFVSVGYMNLASKKMSPVDGHFLPSLLIIRPESALPEVLFSTIEAADLRELDHIDPHRAWGSEVKFQIGQRWPFTTHQLRRSLALYAQRSGLVSLPSLRRQLQHITEEMTRYYQRGSAFARNFIGGQKKHFGLEWQAAQPESAGLSYLINVLLTDETLFGGHANWVEHRLKDKDGVVLIDRDATMLRFKQGAMAYRETLIGGCTNTQECDKVSVRWLHTECLCDGCKNLVCNVSKLDRVISAQQRMVSGLDQGSVEYRTEMADLEILVGAREKALH